MFRQFQEQFLTGGNLLVSQPKSRKTLISKGMEDFLSQNQTGVENDPSGASLPLGEDQPLVWGPEGSGRKQEARQGRSMWVFELQ